MRKRITYRPNKAIGVMGVVVGLIFIAIGFLVVIPAAGTFGVLWTVLAAVTTVINAYVAFGKKYFGPEIRIEDEDPAPEQAQAGPAQPDARARLEQLESLRQADLLTEEEYRSKREEILRSL